MLGALDDKIELNRRMSETLEEMAHALFNSWFVDFDPVRARNECRATALSHATTALFPVDFESGLTGIMPVGWSKVSLSEVIDINPKRTLKVGATAPYLDMANLPTTGHSADQVVLRQVASGSRFMNGDTLLARITPCLENGKTGYVDFLKSGELAWGSTEFIVLRPKLPFPPEYAYCLARSSEFRDFAIQSMTGSSGRQRVSIDALFRYRVVRPSAPVVAAFGTMVSPMFERARRANEESRTLAALRDTLLPKLISGELRIRDAERFVADAV